MNQSKSLEDKMLKRAISDRQFLESVVKEKRIDLEYWEEKIKDNKDLIDILERAKP